MIKLYKNKNPNIKKISLLFVCQVMLGMLPAVLLMVYVVYVQIVYAPQLEDYHLWLGILFISVMFIAFVGYGIAARRYNILLSGYKGERLLVKTAKKLVGNYSVFTNLPIRYKKNRSEIDLLVISEKGILIVEVKNHSGLIIGSDNDDTWIQRKYYRRGLTTETVMDNPFTQIKRQREILKSILRSNEINIWIDSILFFSGNPGLRLDVDCDIGIASSDKELIGLISDYKSKNPITREECTEIIKILRNSNPA